MMVAAITVVLLVIVYNPTLVIATIEAQALLPSLNSIHDMINVNKNVMFLLMLAS